jgi:hypothetical protein
VVSEKVKGMKSWARGWCSRQLEVHGMALRAGSGGGAVLAQLNGAIDGLADPILVHSLENGPDEGVCASLGGVDGGGVASAVDDGDVDVTVRHSAIGDGVADVGQRDGPVHRHVHFRTHDKTAVVLGAGQVHRKATGQVSGTRGLFGSEGGDGINIEVGRDLYRALVLAGKEDANAEGGSVNVVVTAEVNSVGVNASARSGALVSGFRQPDLGNEMSVSEGIGGTAFTKVNRDDPIYRADFTDPFVFATVTEQVIVDVHLHTSGSTGQRSASSGCIEAACICGRVEVPAFIGGAVCLDKGQKSCDEFISEKHT